MHGLEMCLIMVADKPSEVKFAVPLFQVDYDLGTVRLQEVIHLQVIYKIGQSWNFSVPQLKLFTPHRVKELFDVDDLKLPAWHDRMCIKEYLPSLIDRCKRQVQEAYTSAALRKTFIESLSVLFGHPIEADTIYGRKVSVLTSSATFIFLVHFGLGVQFPREQPTLTFQSCLHFDNNGKPVMRLYKEYPWSPRWETSEMVQRIFDFIAEESASFKSYCNDVLQNR
ncbi:hypothetical protein KP509_30G043600 [Ceratopteris richardii]|nr:hypothetical protein KP509_30G043600 [Ceratopteris richardii]